MHDRDELDLMLRSAVSTYAEADADLERRILARISTKAAPAPPRRWLPWAIALPAAAGLLALIVLSASRQTQPPSSRPGQTDVAQRPLVATVRPEASTTPQRTPTRRSKTLVLQSHRAVLAAKNAPLPKLDVFPTPQPLTPEEQAFAVFAVQAPEPERRSLIEAHAQADAPLSIAAIEIPPLEPPDKGAN